MRKIVLVMFFCIYAFNAFSQGRVITGKVTEPNGDEVPGANVVIKGSSLGTFTDAKGAFKLEVPPGQVVLVISFIGYESQEEDITDKEIINVILSPIEQKLSEIVITGYGRREKASFTGSSGFIGTEKFENSPISNVTQALQGSIAGLQMSTSSGSPGAVQDIRIRGISSITAGNAPLFVIDGIPVVSGTNQQDTWYGYLSVMASLNSNDIESITVLKDAGATSLYGARGANGVIIITTKSGRTGKPRISFSSTVGSVSRAVGGPEMLNAAQYDELYYEARVNRGQAATIEEAKIRFPNGWDGVTDTNWKNVVTNDNAMVQSYNLSASGGSSKSNFYASLGYLQEDGVNIGVGFNKTTGKLNYRNSLSDKVIFNTSTTASYIDQKGQMEGASFYGNPDATIVHLHPIDPARNADGTPNLNLGNAYYNPIYIAENNLYLKMQARILHSSAVEYSITDNLRLSSHIGMDFLYTEELNYDPREYGDGAFVNGYSYGYDNRNFNWDWKTILDYNLKITETHKFDFKLVYEAQKNNYHGLSVGGYDIAANGLYYPSSVATVSYYTGFVNDWAMISMLGTATYTWRNNVIIDGTLRREGNSRFADGNRWGTFFSVGGAWIFTQEPFMENINWIQASKFRVSYGITGNAEIGLNEYQAFLGYSGGYNGQSGASPSQLGNNVLGWEKNKNWNFALDFGLFNRLTGTVEYYIRNTYDLLLNVPLSPTSGFTSQRQNFGGMVNKGLEVSMDAKILKYKDFTWNIGFNFTTVENEVTSLPTNSSGEEIGIVTVRNIVKVGESVNAWYLPTWAGVNPENGNPLWYIEGKEGETTSTYGTARKSIQGNIFPTFYGGIDMRIEYRNFYLSSNLYYSTGNKIYDVFALYAKSDGMRNFTVSSGYASLMDRWQKPGDISKNPRNVYQNTFQSSANSTRNLHDGEYWRLRDLTMGYNVPGKLVSKIRIENMNIFIKGTNIWTYFTDKDLQYDPEVKANGLLQLNAPPTKTYVAGINITF